MDRANRSGSGGAVAAQDWAELQEPTRALLWAAMFDAALVGPGTRLLDAGCGAGGAAVLAVARGARVNGCDGTEALLTIARQRVPDGDFRAAPLDHLPFPDGSFTAVIVPAGLAAMADPLAALRELRRVCTAPGRVVVATASGPEEGAQHAISTAVRALLAAPAEVDPWGLAVPGRLDTLLGQASLQVLGSAEVVCPCVYPDAETVWLAQVSSGTMQAVLRTVGTKRLRAALFGALAPYRTAEGGASWEVRYRYVTATPEDVGPSGTDTWPAAGVHHDHPP